jgi:hypothetical protein
MKKYFIILGFLFSIFNKIYATKAPEINCVWLAWCPDTDIKNPTKANVQWDFWNNIVWKFTIDFVVIFIKYIAVIAVISLMLWWVMYILSWWEEEKVKKAKSWIIWSAVWVFMSVSAWWIIKFITQLSISNI